MARRPCPPLWDTLNRGKVSRIILVYQNINESFWMSASCRWLSILLPLLLIGVGLRVHNLDEKSLWADELFTLALAHYNPMLPEQGQPLYRRTDVRQIGDSDTFLTAKAAEQSPPLNDLLEKATVNWLGATELAARLPAALSACALLIWFAGFAWRHPDPYVRRVLRWSLLVLAFYPALIEYAKDGRPYSVGVSAMGMAGLLWMLRWRDGWRAWQPPGWTEVGLFALACYSHYNAAMLVMLLLSGDVVMAIKVKSRQAFARLLVLSLIFSIWLALSAHTIFFTYNGGVAWGHATAWQHTLMTLNYAPRVMHPFWLALASVVLLAVILVRLRQHQPLWNAKGALRLWVLAGLTLLYVVFAGLIAAKVSMAHPRYYIFILPFVAVMMGLILAELRQHWLIMGSALVLVALTAPSLRPDPLIENEDFRAMTLYGVHASDGDTIFLYPWLPNRNMYRVYLERFLGKDPLSRMVGVSSLQDAVSVCAQLKDSTNVVAMGHASGKDRIDEIYAACGARWPQRSHVQFEETFAEHWRSNR